MMVLRARAKRGRLIKAHSDEGAVGKELKIERSSERQ